MTGYGVVHGMHVLGLESACGVVAAHGWRGDDGRHWNQNSAQLLKCGGNLEVEEPSRSDDRWKQVSRSERSIPNRELEVYMVHRCYTREYMLHSTTLSYSSVNPVEEAGRKSRK